MKTTRQGKNTERRVIVTLARHERLTTKTEIKAKLKKSVTWRDIVTEFDTIVRYERKPGEYEELYRIRAAEFAPGYVVGGAAA